MKRLLTLLVLLTLSITAFAQNSCKVKINDSPTTVTNTFSVNTQEDVRCIRIAKVDGTITLLSWGKKIVDLSPLTCGVYVVEITTTNGKYTETIVKN